MLPPIPRTTDQSDSRLNVSGPVDRHQSFAIDEMLLLQIPLSKMRIRKTFNPVAGWAVKKIVAEIHFVHITLSISMECSGSFAEPATWLSSMRLWFSSNRSSTLDSTCRVRNEPEGLGRHQRG